MRAFRVCPLPCRALLALAAPILTAEIITWDVSHLNLVTPPSRDEFLGGVKVNGNTAIGVWFNLFNGEAYVIDDPGGLPGEPDISDGKTDAMEGRYQLRMNLYWAESEEDGLPSSEVIGFGSNTITTSILGTATSVPNAAARSPARLDVGEAVPVLGAFLPAQYIEMAGTYGVWNERGRGFLGVRVLATPPNQYVHGYADVTVFEDGSLRLNGFAYEDTPNTAITTAYIGAPAPTAASGLSISKTTATTISLAWTDNASTETGFKIQRKGPGDIEFVTIATTAADTTTFVDEGLSASTTYEYQVVATTGLDADATNTVSGTTQAVSSPPAQPTTFTATPLTPTTMELTWVDNAIDEVAYRIERDGGGGFALLTNTGPSATSFIDSGLLPGSAYSYRLTATNGLDSASVSTPSTLTFSVRESTGAAAASTAYPSVQGDGVVVGLWDLAPALSTHIEFEGTGGSRLTNIEGGEAGSNSLSNHPTHSAGLIAAQGAELLSKGMAPAAQVEIRDIENDLAEFLAVGMQWPGQNDRIQVANGSYGPIRGWNLSGLGAVKWVFNVEEASGAPQAFDPNFGAYTEYSHDADDVLWQRPYLLMVRSAGNDRDDGPDEGQLVYLSSEDYSSNLASVYNPAVHPPMDGGNLGGYGIVSDAAAAKNTLTVSAISGARRDANGSLVFVNEANDFANWGPTISGRIKPDLVAPGIHIRSAGFASNDAYSTLTGSSQAAPQVAGIAALLVDAWSQFTASNLRASTLKALLIHTADDLDIPGPDPKTGWGLVNARAALDLLIGQLSNPYQGSVREGSVSASSMTQAYPFFSDGSNEFRTTLVWTDPAGAVEAENPLVHDLNLLVVDATGNLHRPYVLPIANPLVDASDPGAAAMPGINPVDTVEQVRIALPAGAYEVQVSYSGSLTTASQAYSLIVTGAVEASALGSGPKPIRVQTIDGDTVEIVGGGFVPGTEVTLRSATGTLLDVSAVTLFSDRVQFDYESGALSDGMYFVTLSAPDGTTSTLRWPVGSGTPSGYEDWLATTFTSVELTDPAITWFGTGDASSHLPLLAAYAFGSNSATVSPDRVPVIVVEESGSEYYLEMTYTRLQDLDVAIHVETAAELDGSWSTLTSSEIVETTDLGDGTERVRMRDTQALASADARRFLRIRVDWE